MLAQILTNLLHERKVNKTAFAKYLGIHRTTLEGYLSGKTFMPSDKIVKTAKYFNVTVAYLFGEAKDVKQGGTDLKILLFKQQEQINKMSIQLEEQNKTINNIANILQKKIK
ncbi:XRE family transcriptional regulator [Paludibacter sp. 221]|uniref:helix-turn-helix domain-containing protein n=1 Tax=Paludibacter sp. 221 TaxID=2302939 RepID=UPI0013D06E14|nr:helix-turn-helix transcriptional regulator [Paludibacter sp. 221]NDV46143.1 XRE family transcriptional regulator [Paludibacter sp. 221]